MVTEAGLVHILLLAECTNLRLPGHTAVGAFVFLFVDTQAFQVQGVKILEDEGFKDVVTLTPWFGFPSLRLAAAGINRCLIGQIAQALTALQIEIPFRFNCWQYEEAMEDLQFFN